MNLKEMHYILTIHDEESISKAAEKLYMSQPSLSQSLQKIEKTLGAKLFKRTSEGLKLTYAGECYVDTANKIIKLYDKLELELSDASNMKKGNISLGVTFYLGTYILPKILPDYSRLFPNIKINLVETTSFELEEHLVKGRIDLAIMHLPLTTDNICYDLFLKEPFLLAVPPNSPINKYAVIKKDEKYPYMDLRHISEEKFILETPSQRIRQISDIILKSSNIKPNIALITKNIETAKCLTAIGLGITFIPESYCQTYKSEIAPNYYLIDKKYQAEWSTILAYSKNANLNKPAKEFRKIFIEKFNKFLG